MITTSNENLITEMINYFSDDPKRIQHFIKVYEFAKLIGTLENLDRDTMKILEVAAIVHDIGIKPAEEKFGSSSGKLQEQEGPNAAKILLKRLGYDGKLIHRVCYLIAHHHTYDSITETDYQILVEADFLVNMYEDNLSKESIKSVYTKIFKTKTGKKICSEMYQIN